MSDGRHCLRCARNAWQKLGNMSPEEAMEQYITLLSDRVPDWLEDNYSGDDKLEANAAGKADALAPPDLSSVSGHHSYHKHEWNLNLRSSVEGGDLTGGQAWNQGPKNEKYGFAA